MSIKILVINKQRSSLSRDRQQIIVSLIRDKKTTAASLENITNPSKQNTLKSL